MTCIPGWYRANITYKIGYHVLLVKFSSTLWWVLATPKECKHTYYYKPGLPAPKDVIKTNSSIYRVIHTMSKHHNQNGKSGIYKILKRCQTPTGFLWDCCNVGRYNPITSPWICRHDFSVTGCVPEIYTGIASYEYGETHIPLTMIWVMYFNNSNSMNTP